jgi:transitional endoplasmic reticulum ATPase
MDRAPTLARLDSFSAYRPHAERWALRLIVRFRGWAEGAPIWAFAALSRILHPTEDRLPLEPRERSELWMEAAERLRALEAAALPAETPLFRNVRLLAEHLALSGPEEDVLLITVTARMHAPLREVLRSVGECDDARLAEVLGIALARPAEEILAAIDRSSVLFSSGLLHLQAPVVDPVERLSPLPALGGILTRTYSGFDELFAAFARQAPESSLGPEDFAHLEGALDLLASYLARASSTKSKGKNVLLYGIPGTGKTELARLAARMANLKLYEAEVGGRDHEPYDVKHRLRAAALLQQMLASHAATAVLVDEAEDIFRPQGHPEPETRRMAAADSKGWTVRFLESNPVPTIWISNRVSQIDEAVLRRFDLAMEIPVPPLAVRRRILERSLRVPLTVGPEIERILRDCAPAPALLSRAGEVLSLAGREGGEDAARTLERIVRGYLAVLGRDVGPAPQAPFTFEPRCANVTPGIEEMLRLLRSGRAARVLLHGPSGAGKSACAHYLAERLGAALLTVGAADLIAEPDVTCFLLRRAFENARRDRAILFLDQLDWLVCAPADPRPLFQQKALDVLYGCLDAHPGSVFCATSHDAGLDAGFVRRFPARMRFEWLKTHQVAALVRARLGDEAAAALAPRLAGLRPLTAGDIVAALEHVGQSASEGLDRIFAVLAEGEKLKSGGSAAAIGFIAS